MGMSDGNNSCPIWLFVLVAIFITVLWIRYCVEMRRRREQMREMAPRLGLQPWPDDSTPYDLSLDGTVFESWTKLFNVYEGRLHGRQVAVLDFRKQAGKSSWSRTIIAAKTKDDVFAHKAF